METIYKYGLGLRKEQEVELPMGAKILSVQVQGRDIMLWALVRTDEKIKIRRRIKIVATGGEANSSDIHIATIQMENGTLIWHVFETKETTTEGAKKEYAL